MWLVWLLMGLVGLCLFLSLFENPPAFILVGAGGGPDRCDLRVPWVRVTTRAIRSAFEFGNCPSLWPGLRNFLNSNDHRLDTTLRLGEASS